MTLDTLIYQCHQVIQRVAKVMYPKFQAPYDWNGLLIALEAFRPTLHYLPIMWTFPYPYRIKGNSDGASRGNPGEEFLSLLPQGPLGNLIYAEAER